MEEADILCERIAIMDHGRFVALDFLVLAAFAAALLFLGAHFFEKSESV